MVLGCAAGHEAFPGRAPQLPDLMAIMVGAHNDLEVCPRVCPMYHRLEELLEEVAASRCGT